ncbi:MAG: pilin [Candidatus Komeilibacteria bacterium]
MFKKNRANKFITGVLAGFLLLFGLVWFSAIGQAANEGIKFVPQTTIPGVTKAGDTNFTVTPDTLGNYINAIYQYGVGVVAVLAVVMIMLGGFKWIFSGGSAERISSAKGTITNAIVGLILVLTSWLLLSTINPALVVFPSLQAPKPNLVAGDCPMLLKDNNFVRQCSDFNNIGDYLKTTESAKTIQDYCLDQDAQAACGLPKKLCYWDDGENLCASIVEKECATASDCQFNDETFICEKKTNHCSLGVEGSYCLRNDECTSESNLICAFGECVKDGDHGFFNGTWRPETEWQTGIDCPPGYVGETDSDSPDGGGNCIRRAPLCDIQQDCFSNSGDYIGWTDSAMTLLKNDCGTEGDVKRCDCDSDKGCSSGRCINTRNGQNDVCYPD